MTIYSVTMVLWKEPRFLFAEPWKGVGNYYYFASTEVAVDSGIRFVELVRILLMVTCQRCGSWVLLT